MSNFPGLMLTRQGQDLLAKLQSGGEMQFTRVATGSGRMPPGDNVFSALSAAAVATISNSENGAAAAVDVNSGFTVTITTPGGGSAAQVVEVTCLAADQLAGGEYFSLSSPYLTFHVWFRVGELGTDPAPADSIPIQVDLTAGNSATVVAAKLAIALDDHRLAMSDLYRLITEQQDLAVQSVTRVDAGVSEIAVVLSNQGLQNGYTLREIGVFATDPATLTEILYAVTNADEQSDYFPAEGGATLIEVDLRLRTLIATAADLTMQVAGQAYAGLVQFIDHLDDATATPEQQHKYTDPITTTKHYLAVENGILILREA